MYSVSRADSHTRWDGRIRAHHVVVPRVHSRFPMAITHAVTATVPCPTRYGPFPQRTRANARSVIAPAQSVQEGTPSDGTRTCVGGAG